MLKFIVNKSFENTSIKKFLSFYIKRLSLQKVLKNKDFKVNHKKVDINYQLKINDEVLVYGIKDKDTINFEKCDIPIIYEDENIICINKPAGISSQLGNKLNKSIKSIFDKKYGKIYMVHRLDKDTTGVMVLAKNLDFAKVLNSLFKKRLVTKKYYAIALGSIKDNHFIVDDEIGKTEFDIIKKENDWTFLDIRLHTGHMHQIRKHLSNLKHPVILDNLYGDFQLNKEYKKIYKLKNMMLQSYFLEFKIGNKKYTFQSEKMGDFKKFTK